MARFKTSNELLRSYHTASQYDVARIEKESFPVIAINS
jgi:hypothetical protein